jgi:hypothetical protein
MRLQKTSKDFIRLQKQGADSGLQDFKRLHETSKDFMRLQKTS